MPEYLVTMIRTVRQEAQTTIHACSQQCAKQNVDEILHSKTDTISLSRGWEHIDTDTVAIEAEPTEPDSDEPGPVTCREGHKEEDATEHTSNTV